MEAQERKAPGGLGGAGEIPREEKAHEGRSLRAGLKNRARGANAREEQGPETEPVFSGAVPQNLMDDAPALVGVNLSDGAAAERQVNRKRAEASERAYGFASGCTLESENPKGGTGMKQGRQVSGGIKP